MIKAFPSSQIHSLPSADPIMESVLNTNDDGDLDYTHYDEDRGLYSSAEVTRERLTLADPGQSRTILQQVKLDI